MQRKSFQSGKTLMEVLVACGIAAMMIACLLPAVNSAREAGRKMQCQANMRELSLAICNYEANYRALPSNAPVPWTVETLRYLSPPIITAALAGGASEAEIAWDLSSVASNEIPYFLCPTAKRIRVDGRSISNYALNSLVSGIQLSQITDGTSSTILVGEIPSESASLWTWGPFADGSNIDSSHPTRFCCSLVDGSVHSLGRGIDRNLLDRLLNPADGVSDVIED
jgi:hypothetical protein